MPLLPRPELNNVTIGTHGGLDYSEIKSLGLAGSRILDFSVCCNPYPLPQSVRKSLHSLKINLYPDSQSGELRCKLADNLGISTENILVGSGTTELIRLIALAYFNRGDRVLIPRPAYGEYEIASRIAGTEIFDCRWDLQESDSTNISALLGAIERSAPKAVFLCNPNNPTGYYLSRADLENIISNLADALLILDEAYINFVDDPWSSLSLINNGNIILLRSMTKDYGLAGLRLGYAVAAENIINTLRRVCPPWNVNIAAQKAGMAVLDDEEFLKQSQRKIREAGQFLIGGLRRLGLDPLPAKTHFFLFKTTCGKTFRTALLQQGILVRDCASFGLPEYIRIAPRNLTDCRKLLKALNKVLDTNKQFNGELDNAD